ncbi:MAG: energy transducer TonB [Flavobacteriales bacterium]|nr:energy transducer TonB [Flavobacteriales bacterium]
MEPKKNTSVDLEPRKPLLFQLGIVIALAFVLVAFEWAQYEKSNMDLGQLNLDLEEEEMIPITQQAPPPPPPPPPPPQTTVIEIVEDDKEVEDELDINTEMDEDTKIEIVHIEEEEEVIAEPEIFTIVEDMPSFPGGEAKLYEYLGKNLKYPPMAKDAGIQGIVYVTFVVKENGAIDGVRVLRGIGGGADEEAVRVVKNMPSWKPGKQRGKAVRVQYNMPIRFVLK